MHHPFTLEKVLAINGSPSALLHFSNKLFVGFSDGSLHRYTLHSPHKDEGPPKATLESSVASLRKQTSSAAAGVGIDSLALIKETNSLAVLSGGDVGLYDVATLQLQTACERWTKGQAGSMWIDTSVMRQDGRGLLLSDAQKEANGSSARRGSSIGEIGKGRGGTSSPSRLHSRLSRSSKAASVVEISSPSSTHGGVPVLLTTLAVPCRRRLVLFSWRDGEWAEPREVSLPHQARSLCFPTPLKIFLGYSTGDYATLSLPSSPSAQPSLSEPFAPPITAAVGGAAAAPAKSDASQTVAATADRGGGGFSVGLSGLAARTGNLVSLGLGPGSKISRNPVVKVGSRANEVLGIKEALATFMTPDGRLSRPTAGVPGISYPTTPDEVIVVGPYVLSTLVGPNPTLQVHSVPSLQLAQTVQLPSTHRSDDVASQHDGSTPKKRQSLPPAILPKLLTASISGRAPIFFSAAASTGSPQGGVALYMLSMESWTEQAAELTASGEYEEALALLTDVDLISLPDKPDRIAKLEALAAVRTFTAGGFEDAIDTFINLETTPAKVIAMYPERISGKFCKPKEEWEQLFGGRTKDAFLAAPSNPVEADVAPTEDGRPASPKPSFGSGGKEDDVASVRSAASHAVRRPLHDKASKRSLNRPVDDFRSSVDNLVRYLTDRRQNINKALAGVSTPVSQLRADTTPRPVYELFAIPSVPMAQLGEVDLAQAAQVVDTALFRCYLATKPSMLGPLCRLDNWCQVDEVEALLMEAKRYHELLDLYHGKALHDRALKLLKTMSEEEDDPEERLQPTVRYLQKLGPDHLDLILSTSRWVLAADRAAALEIFTADLGAVESLPRHSVARHLEREDPLACVGYLEHVIGALGEEGPDLHEKLAGLYIAQSMRLRSEGDGDAADATYGKLLTFLRASKQYSPEWVLARLPPNGMLEARALTLGRMGRHDAALTIYVQRLDDPATAEEYCKTVYASSPDSKGTIFLALLRILLRPAAPASSDPNAPQAPAHFDAALRLIAAHASRIDAASALELLPPLVKLSDVAVFLEKALRTAGEERREGEAVRGVWRGRLDQLERGKVGLEERRVRIDDARA